MNIEGLRAYWLHIGDPRDHERCKLCGKDMRLHQSPFKETRIEHWKWYKYCTKCGELMREFEMACDKRRVRLYYEEQAMERKRQELTPDLI